MGNELSPPYHIFRPLAAGTDRPGQISPDRHPLQDSALQGTLRGTKKAAVAADRSNDQGERDETLGNAQGRPLAL